MLRRLTVCLTVLSLLFVSIAPLTAIAFAAPAAEKHGRQKPQGKVAPEFATTAATSTETVRVIVQTKGRPTAAQDQAIESRHGQKRQTFDTLNTLVVDLPAGEVASLAARDDVVYVSPDRPVRAQLDVTREATGAALVQAGRSGPKENPGFTGKGVTIAVLDSGINTNHPDFQRNNKSRVLASVNFTASGSGVSENGIVIGDGVVIGDGIVIGDGDRNGHGTGVAGVAAGSGAASHGYAGNYSGIAPDANLVDLKVLDENGVGTTSAALNAINWAITNQKRYDIRVINMSLGTPAR